MCKLAVWCPAVAIFLLLLAHLQVRVIVVVVSAPSAKLLLGWSRWHLLLYHSPWPIRQVLRRLLHLALLLATD